MGRVLSHIHGNYASTMNVLKRKKNIKKERKKERKLSSLSREEEREQSICGDEELLMTT